MVLVFCHPSWNEKQPYRINWLCMSAEYRL